MRICVCAVRTKVLTGIASESNVELLEELVHAGQERLRAVGPRELARFTVKDLVGR